MADYWQQDDTRAWGPPYAKYSNSDQEGPGESAYYLGVSKTEFFACNHLTSIQVNRNKRSIGLSFAHPAGVDILHRLVKECDVLVENYLPGSLAKYAMDYATVSKINPGLIYASITGYGQTGPYSNRAGYDVMVEAYVSRFKYWRRPDMRQRIRTNAHYGRTRWSSC